METELARPETIDHALRILSWCVIAFGALWLVTSVIGVMHRRAYNLTHAESGGSKDIKPDFLKVDHAKRKEAIARGEAYDTVLKDREAAVSQKTAAKVGTWSRLLAVSAAVLGLVTAAAGAVGKVKTVQTDFEQIGTWDRFVDLISQNPVGTVVALAVIGANVIIVVQKIQKPE